MATFPTDRLERIELALGRALERLPGEVRAKLSELQSPDSLLGFALVVGVWGGLQLTPLGVPADLILSAWGALALGASGYQLVVASVEASEAQTDGALNQAATKIANAIVDIGADLIAAILGNALFGQVKRLAKVIRPKLGKAPIQKLALPEPVAAAGVGVGAVNAAPVVGSAAMSILKYGLPVAGGVAVLIALASRRSARRRSRP